MNLEKIKEVLDSNLPKEATEYLIIDILAKDENILTAMFKILEQERIFKKEMHLEMNLLLSKADIGLKSPKMNKDHFMNQEILEFYEKYKNHTGHCFKNSKP